MKIYIGNAGKRQHIQMMKENGWGRVHLANAWRNPEIDLDWMLDNGAYSCWVNGLEFDSDKFLESLDKIEVLKLYPDFIVVPDIVAAGYDSLDFSLSWINQIPGGYNCYLAVQDGMELDIISEHIELFDGLFVGGTLDWKLKTAQDWVQLAHNNNQKCHIGRVGTFKRLVWAKHIGADSIDSSTFAQARPGTGFRRIKAALSQTCFNNRPSFFLKKSK